MLSDTAAVEWIDYMTIVVQKYGGSSVADLEKLRSVARQVVERQAAGDQVVVVVSAMGKTTDHLLDQARDLSPSPSRRELDMLVTAGERISMTLLSIAILELGARAISFTGSQSGIITEDSHQGARILEIRPHRIEQALAEGSIVIVAGYQGVSLKREVTTLGRGGSDTTAVALAAALGADCCEIYSDVDGVYDADPNVCTQARLIPTLDYDTMQTMAGAGAKVLNAQAVEFAKAAGIRIVARKTADPSGRETIISESGGGACGVRAVVGSSVVSRIWGRDIAVSDLAQGIREAGGRIISLVAGTRVECIVNRDQIPLEQASALRALAKQLGADYADVGLVTIVGHELVGEVWKTAAGLVSDAGIADPYWVANPQEVAVCVPVESVDAVVQLLHTNLISD